MCDLDLITNFSSCRLTGSPSFFFVWFLAIEWHRYGQSAFDTQYTSEQREFKTQGTDFVLVFFSNAAIELS